MKNIEILSENRGLICDNPNCDWCDMNIKDEDIHLHINAKCPICGDIILTQEDYDNGLKLRNVIDFINLLSEEQINDLYSGFDIESLKKFPIFKDIDLTKAVNIEVNTHNGINIVGVNNTDNTDNIGNSK
jgi:hypothetical protein